MFPIHFPSFKVRKVEFRSVNSFGSRKYQIPHSYVCRIFFVQKRSLSPRNENKNCKY